MLSFPKVRLQATFITGLRCSGECSRRQAQPEERAREYFHTPRPEIGKVSRGGKAAEGAAADLLADFAQAERACAGTSRGGSRYGVELPPQP